MKERATSDINSLENAPGNSAENPPRNSAENFTFAEAKKFCRTATELMRAEKLIGKLREMTDATVVVDAPPDALPCADQVIKLA